MNLLIPETVDVQTLPSIRLEERPFLPNTPAIYFVLNAHGRIEYIGMAKSLCFRWRSHHRLGDFKKMPHVRIAYLAVTDAALLSAIEKALIKYFDPPLNRPRTDYKRGPKPMSDSVIKVSFLCPTDLWDWAADQPEGASRLIRDLLDAERTRRTPSPSS